MTFDSAPPLSRILLIDDDEVTNLMHTRVIERSGQVAQIDVATDGLAALDILRADIAAGRMLPELIFLDINMPRMGGFEFLEEYAALGIDAEELLIIVMLSTSLLKRDHDRAEADPNVHCFTEKPLQLEMLLALIDEIQHRRSTRVAVA
ncbi:response regulator [Sulfitobacter sp. HNIBRBA3233]|uniref:response regulator n=1 Tax=Sulfitobacter marinivivus TaxID=3158558 RepID=UPI0032DE4FEA